MTWPVLRRLAPWLLLLTPVFVSGQAPTAPPAAAPDMVDRIFKLREFSPRAALQPQWFDGGASYLLMEPAAGGSGVTVVRDDSATGAKRDVLSPPVISLK